MRNEPLVEATQVKGTSDTHPALSPNDEWANFEIMPYKVATTIISEPAGSYVRNAYPRGLKIADGGVKNPYKFGLIGSSDGGGERSRSCVAVRRSTRRIRPPHKGQFQPV